MTDFFNEEMVECINELEAWFAELKQGLGLSEDADKEDVLEEVRRLCEEHATYEKEKALVVAAFEKGSWEELMKDGALIRAGIIAGLDR